MSKRLKIAIYLPKEIAFLRGEARVNAVTASGRLQVRMQPTPLVSIGYFPRDSKFEMAWSL